MSFENPLSNLKDIHIPPEISFWPPAFGWWMVSGIFFLIIILSSFWFWSRFLNFKPRKEALRILNDIQYEFEKNKNDSETLKDLSKLVRCTALTFYSREEIASLHGVEWLNFLDRSGETEEFSKGVGDIFGKEIYKKNPKIKSISLFLVVKNWINVITKKNKK